MRMQDPPSRDQEENPGGKMKTLWSAAFCLIMVLLLSLGGVTSAAPSPAGAVLQEIQLTARENGQIVDLNGEVLVLNLESNPSTGYGWQVQGLDTQLLRQIGASEWLPDTPGKLGGPGTEVLRFAAIGRGQTTLNLVYARPWETAAAGSSFSLEVNVNEPSRNASYPQPAAAAPLAATTDGESLDALPAAYNWCSLGGCTPVRDQGQCGSCWAFGTVGPLESAILIQDGQSKDLAEQYLVSCNTDGWGCDGGWWAHDYHEWKYPPGEPGPGAVYEADFPYTATDAPCNGPYTHHETIADWVFVGSENSVPSTDAIKQAIVDHGPVSAAVCVNSAFQAYTGGVFNPIGWCLSINHAIVLVGWDDGLGAWRLRNSWGDDWGEDGYMWIAYGKNYVGYSANYVVYSGSTQPTPPTVSIVDPAEGHSIAGIYRVRVAASDDSAISQVELSIDGGAYVNITANHDGTYYFYDWDTTAYTDGSHTLRARATDDAAQSTESTLVNVTVDNVNEAPIATFAYNCSGLDCSFDGLASYDPDGTVIAYAWVFGDGNTATGATASHTFAAAGTYQVGLTVTDDEDATGTDTQDVTVAEAAKLHIGDLDGDRTTNKNKWTAIVTVAVHDAAHAPMANATVTGFWSSGSTASCITGADGLCQVTQGGLNKNIASIDWTVQDVTHSTFTYDAAANQDPDGDSDGTTIRVYLEPPTNQPPVATFTYNCSDLSCGFDGSGSYDPDGTVAGYAWNFGDGNSASGSTASHTYAAAGTYSVVLIVTDDGGATGSDTQAVAVGGGGGSTMYVFSIEMSGKTAGVNRSATAVVTIRDTAGNPVSGATVYGTWSGDYAATVNGVTGADGTVSFTSGNVKLAGATFTFTVDDVVLAGYAYDPSLNVEDSDTIVVP
jgi:PKD repeat protein/predicted secreted protein